MAYCCRCWMCVFVSCNRCSPWLRAWEDLRAWLNYRKCHVFCVCIRAPLHVSSGMSCTACDSTINCVGVQCKVKYLIFRLLVMVYCTSSYLWIALV